MTYGPSYYMSLLVQSLELEKVLNHIEELASGCYEIITYIPCSANAGRLVIRFEIKEGDPVFDEEEILKKLGY